MADPTIQPPVPQATPAGTAFLGALQGLLGNQQARLGQVGGIRRRAYEDLRMRGLIDQLLARQRTGMGDLAGLRAQPGLSPQILGMLAQIQPRPGFTHGAGRLAYQYAPGGQAGGPQTQGAIYGNQQYPGTGGPPGGVWNQSYQGTFSPYPAPAAAVPASIAQGLAQQTSSQAPVPVASPGPFVAPYPFGSPQSQLAYQVAHGSRRLM